MENVALDFLFIAGLWGLLSPLIVNLLKDIGGDWPEGAKKAAAVVLAILGSFVAVGVAEGWESINLGDWEGFWQPLIIGFAAVIGTQYASYRQLWQDTRVAEVLHMVGRPKDDLADAA